MGRRAWIAKELNSAPAPPVPNTTKCRRAGLTVGVLTREKANAGEACEQHTDGGTILPLTWIIGLGTDEPDVPS